ncbi:AmmeMemoRadiSam system protein A [Desulforhopalus vacuolatus]|uniref:AmmeMemoRadiSam system protein A n=1 Tax=Desulforhopalus vacuolatus TaxID=40414 RepID=UPI0019648A24|nr:AmmeMemoRadiSam system protein A [Desulforhopalus vacuolatus]MBM9518969.1 AmmeMemoRadiSam system protein A [Desulforhopalus vacuolatus]
MIDSILLRIAKTAILSRFDRNIEIDRNKLLTDYPFLQLEAASFVTLNYNHQLRGCIGSIIAQRKLLDDIIQNAESAAFNDYRFKPLSKDELQNLHIEVSILTPPEELSYTDFDNLRDKIRPDIDGLILKYGQNQGTFLPQVWETLKTPKEFLDHLSYKAGLSPSVYEKHPTIYRYEVKAIENYFDAIAPL